ncbi:putative periplasmic nitrate reductase subunit NapG [Magnetofaba australis IT-1]|uniref:Putative periplasmic nitrate reductase subunit NapG n=1 Tax=Magnetofaba australis IT-1 TaxID=1434232 RepID=A0A1Y2K7Z5_9PROT|nr:putative periplasmic nitrate reductase subunit NapG [Magnetofaba australis IT-1]
MAVCPSGALDPQLKKIELARMGLAVLIDHEACIAFQGLRCEVCFNVCPVRGKAITLEYRRNQRTGMHAFFIPVVHSSDCTGCGKCEKACILEEAAIKVLPFELAKGMLGKHYRLGWKEKQKAGHAIIGDDVKHRYNLPEGMHYEHAGRGLVIDQPPGAPAPLPGSDALPDSPFPDDPLKRLNSGKGGI